MEKTLQVMMPDGSCWHVPARIVAEHRADYFAAKEHGRGSIDYARVLAEELADASDYDIRDWAANNMEWSDLSASAERVRDVPTPDYDEMWNEAVLHIVGGDA